MPRVAPLQSNFSGGEISPLAYGRVDADRYATSLKTCLNYLPTVQGGLTRRTGTVFVNEVKNSADSTRLIPFEFSTTQAYVIEFGDQYCRFFKDQGAILESGVSITGITNGNPAQVTASSHGFSNGDVVWISGVVGMTEVNSRYFKVANSATNTFDLQDLDGNAIDSNTYGTYSSGGTVARLYEIASPYTKADLFELKFTQSADVLYLTHPDYAPRKLSRTGHTAWTFTEIDFQDGPYLATNSTATTLAQSGSTITASSTTGINGGDGFKSTDVGRPIRIKNGSNWEWKEITTFTDTTHVDVDDSDTISATASWRLGVWSETTGYPSTATFHEDRLVFGGPTDNPQRIDASNTSDYENFAPTDADGTIPDNRSLAFTFNANQVNAIRWMLSDEKGMVVGTVGGEWLVRPSIQGEALTPSNITAKQATTYGSADLQALKSGKAALFVQRSGRKVRELNYFFDVDGFQAGDLTILANHITESGIKDTAYVEEPQPIVWMARNDGTLVGVTYERSPDSLRAGWHRHVIGGVGDASGNAPDVESVAAIPAPDGTYEELWLVLKRYINGETVRYIEYLSRHFDDETAQEDSFFVDSGLTYDGASTSTVSGLDHLEGETVAILADGAVQASKTVTNGAITLDTAASVVHVGYNYNSDGEMLRLEAGAADGTALGKTRRTNRIAVMFYRSLGLKLGFDLDNAGDLDTITFRTTATQLNNPPALFSGIKTFEVNGGYDFDNFIAWRQDQPLPSTILAVAPQMVTQDRG